MDTGVVAMAYSSRDTFDYTRDLLRDSYDHAQHESPKYGDQDLPQPESKEAALPNSEGIPAS